MSDETPSPDGRDPDTGRFGLGNKSGRGNPFMSRVVAYRKAIWDAISNDDVARLAKKMLLLGEAGDVAAAKVVFERTAGRPLEETGEQKPADNDLADALIAAARRVRELGGA